MTIEIDMSYEDYLNSDLWQNKRKERLKKDNYTCQSCYKRDDNDVHVHHITYDRTFNEHIFDVVTLCSKCHNQVHAEIGDIKKVKETTEEEFMQRETESAYMYANRGTDAVGRPIFNKDGYVAAAIARAKREWSQKMKGKNNV